MAAAAVASDGGGGLGGSDESGRGRNFDEAVELLKEFSAEFERDPCDVNKCKRLLSELKIRIADFPSCQPNPVVTSQRELLVAREALELAAFLSVKNRDVEAFERHVAQLTPYYRDFVDDLPRSQRTYIVQGMYLLHLLASNRIGEFHMALELIPVQERSNYYIKHLVELERHLMDGAYGKVIAAQQEVPLPMYSFFMEGLMETVRLKIAECLEKAYGEIDASHAAKLLLFETVQELKVFADSENARKKEEGDLEVVWRVDVATNTLKFVSMASQMQEVPALELLHYVIGYATELERIV